MENIKTLKKEYSLTHDRFVNDNGILVDSFDLAENNGDEIIHYPFLPIIKIGSKESVLDATTDYTEQEYQEMLKEQIKKLNS